MRKKDLQSPNVIVVKDRSSGGCAQGGCGLVLVIVGVLLILFVVGAAMGGGG